MSDKPSQPGLLLLDIGNSTVKAGWSDGTRLVATRRHQICTPDEAPRAAETILAQGPIDKILFMSVNPSNSERILNVLKPCCPAAAEVGSDVPRGIRIKTDEPERVGTDRTTTALAAYEIYKGALVVVDFGTAITFDCVGHDGEFLGGVICSGLSMSASALERDTAFLPAVEVFPRKSFLATNTEEAIVSGIYHGAVEAANGIIEGLSKELGGNVSVVATGGDAQTIAPACGAIQEIRPDLSLEGLLILYKRHGEQTLAAFAAPAASSSSGRGVG